MNEKFIVVGDDYKKWLNDVKFRIRSVQLKAVISANRELLQFYWELGADIVQKQANAHWGDGFLKQLSTDLMAEFPEMKGFSLSNIKYVKQWHLFYNQHDAISQQPVGQLKKQPVSQLLMIPWGHNIAIISKCKDIKEALYAD
jgi:predicted nuclease of restriction endonuclease-like (RecB) superfamily